MEPKKEGEINEKETTLQNLSFWNKLDTDEQCELRTAHHHKLQKARAEGENAILNQTTVGWDVDIHQLDGTTCKWRLVNKYDTNHSELNQDK